MTLWFLNQHQRDILISMTTQVRSPPLNGEEDRTGRKDGLSISRDPASRRRITILSSSGTRLVRSYAAPWITFLVRRRRRPYRRLATSKTARRQNQPSNFLISRWLAESDVPPAPTISSNPMTSSSRRSAWGSRRFVRSWTIYTCNRVLVQGRQTTVPASQAAFRAVAHAYCRSKTELSRQESLSQPSS